MLVQIAPYERLKDFIYAGIFSNNLQPIAFLDFDSGMTIANKLFCWRLGISASKAVNEIPLSSLPFHHNPRFTSYMESMQSSFSTPEDLLLELDIDEENQFPITLKMLAIKDEESTCGIIITTLEKQAHENELDLHLEKMAQLASHDLREPLRTIGNYAQLLRKTHQKNLDEKGQIYLQEIVAGVQQLNLLLNDMLAYSIQPIQHDKETFSPKVLVNEIEQSLRIHAIKKDFKINIEYLPETITTSIENFRILLYHLFDNAVKFSPLSSTSIINLDCEELITHWKFSVTDNGPGILKEYHTKIFGLFKRLYRRDELPGNGLGLAICRRIIEQQGGRIWVKSEPGIGSTFFFTIVKPQ